MNHKNLFSIAPKLEAFLGNVYDILGVELKFYKKVLYARVAVILLETTRKWW